MVLVGRLLGGPDTGKRKDAGGEIEKRMGGIGEDGHATGEQPDQQLGADQDQVDGDRVECRRGLAVQPAGCARLSLIHGSLYWLNCLCQPALQLTKPTLPRDPVGRSHCISKV